MGKMVIDGELREKPSADDGRFVRLHSDFRDWITNGHLRFLAQPRQTRTVLVSNEPTTLEGAGQ